MHTHAPHTHTCTHVCVMFHVLYQRYGFVDYPTTEEAQEALKYNGMAFRGQRLNISMANETHSTEGNHLCIHYIVI